MSRDQSVSTEWPEDRVATLVTLWENDATPKTIQATLGKGITLNAIYGKARRLGLPTRKEPTTPEQRLARRREQARKAMAKLKSGAGSRIRPLSDETLAAIRRMWTDEARPEAVATRLGISVWRVEEEFAGFRDELRDEIDPFADAAFVERLLADGGLPRAVITPRGPVWLGPNNRPWFDPTRQAA